MCCRGKLGGRASGAGSFERGSRGRVGGRPPAPPGQHTQVRNRGPGAKGGGVAEEGPFKGVRNKMEGWQRLAVWQVVRLATPLTAGDFASLPYGGAHPVVT